MHLEFLGVEEDRPLARRIDAVDLALVTAACVNGPVGSGDHRPDERSVGFVDRRRRRAERQSSEGIDREVLDLPAEELGLG